MSSNSILLSDPNFDKSQSRECELLIKIGFDTFSYAIVNLEDQKVEVLFDEQECNDVAQKFQEKLETDENLNLRYQSVKIAAYTPNVINIPAPFYQEDDLEAYTQYFNDKDFSTILTRPLQKHQIVFAFNSAIDDLVNDQFTDVKQYSHFHSLIETQNDDVNKLIFDFSVKSFSIIYLEAGQLQFQQVYEYDDVEEFNYYLLLIVSQLGIDPSNTTIELSGVIHENDGIYSLLDTYFSHITFRRITNLNLDNLDDMPIHYYSALLALHSCG